MSDNKYLEKIAGMEGLKRAANSYFKDVSGKNVKWFKDTLKDPRFTGNDHLNKELKDAVGARNKARAVTGVAGAGAVGVGAVAHSKMEKSALALSTANYVGGALGLLGSRLATERGSKSNGEIAGALAGGAVAPAAYEAGEKLTRRVVSNVGQKSPASIGKIVKNMNKAGPIGAKVGLTAGALGAGYLAGKAYNHVAKK